MQMTIGIIMFWVVLITLVLGFNVPPPLAKSWVQNNTEQSLQWILEAKE